MKILHVEDNPGDAKLVRYAFEEAALHIEIDWVSNCGEATECLARCEPENCSYDLVLTDMQLPDGNGISLLPFLQEHGIQIPLIVVTGRDDKETALSALKAGASDYVVKTDRYLKDLPGILDAALERYRSEIARHVKPLHVLYGGRNRQDIEAVRAHLALSAPFIHLDIVYSDQSLLQRFPLTGTNEGLQREKSGYPCDIILLDDQLPGMLSLSLLKELRSLRRVDVPIIFMSGEGNHETAIQALRLGADDYIARSPGYLYRLPIVLENVFNRVQVEREQKALAESENQYRSLVENSLAGVFIIQNRVIRFVNDRFCEITGYKSDELKNNMDITTLIHQDCRQAIEESLRRFISEPEGFQQDLKVFGKGNRLLHVKAFISPVTFRGRLAAAGICIDTTHEKALEGQLRQAQKMEAIGTLAGGIAHDFNNILGVMLGYSELACEMVPDRPEALQMIKSTMKAVYRAKDLVQQILTFSRQTEMEKTPVKIIPLVKETVQFLRASLPTTIRIQTSINATEDTVIADPTKIHQVLINLSTNAAHAMKDHGGDLTITVENVHLGDSVQDFAQSYEAGHYLKLTVTDTGHGIPAQDMDRIFEPYFTTKKEAEGTGLGLAVVHGIVREHGGQINVCSEEGQGATFQIFLPLSKVSLKIESDITSSEITRGHGKILFVDDEEALTNVGKQLLERLGYDVTAYTDPLEALAEFRQNEQFFDCVITDRTMPLMTGFDLAHEIHAVRPDIPIILCSGFLDKEDTDKAADMGITKIIFKPFDTSVLADTIWSALNKIG
ncbi:MAG: response regulator [Deltaproteobacteria bacterium]|nr:response regulator [Deltaproteobacteria bacterium]